MKSGKSNLKWIAIFIIMSPLIIGAGMYLFLWWKIKVVADNFSEDISPFAIMSYQSVLVDLTEARIGLREVSFIPVGMEDEISIKSIIFSAPSIGSLLGIQTKLSQGELPDELNIHINKIRASMGDDYMQAWQQSMLEVRNESGSDSELIACGNVKMLGIPEMMQMGYSYLESNIGLQYQLDSTNGRLDMELSLAVDNMFDSRTTMVFPSKEEQLSLQVLPSIIYNVKRVEFWQKDKGFNQRYSSLCARLNHETVEQYYEKYTKSLRKSLKYEGWTLPNSVFEAYRKVSLPNSEINLRVDIPNSFNIQQIKQPLDILYILNPYVELNGEPVYLDGITWFEPDPDGERLLQELRKSEEDRDSSAQESSKMIHSRRYEEPKEDKKAFKSVDISELEEHIGQPVILYTYFGQKVQGRLLSIDNNIVVVRRRLPNDKGTATYPINRKRIQNARLYF